MRKYPRFAIRKIRNGRAKIFGRWFYPDPKWIPYDGRLDGMRYAFGLYLTPEGEPENFVNLWGCEAQYLAKTPEEYGTEYKNDPQVIEDGTLPWATWGTEEWIARR